MDRDDLAVDEENQDEPEEIFSDIDEYCFTSRLNAGYLSIMNDSDTFTHKVNKIVIRIAHIAF